jgi:hypothetical protein
MLTTAAPSPQAHDGAAAASSEPAPVPLPAASSANSGVTVTPRPASSAKKLTYEQLEKRQTGFLKPGESLKPYGNSKAVAFSHFRPFQSVDSKTHLCVLCPDEKPARVNLTSQSNATVHMKTYHKAELEAGLPFTPPPSLSVEEQTRANLLAHLQPATTEQMTVIHHYLLKFVADQLLPKSIIENGDLRTLLQVCAMMPSVKVRRYFFFLLILIALITDFSRPSLKLQPPGRESVPHDAATSGSRARPRHLGARPGRPLFAD